MQLNQIHGPVVLEIPSDPASLFLVRCLVERLAQRLEFSEETVGQLTLAVDEACTNVIRHAYANRNREKIVITFLVETDRMEVRIRDFGTSPDPKTIRPRDLKTIRPGGLGTHFIKSIMDEVHYETQQDGGCMLRMVKYRIAAEGGDT